MNQGQDGVFEIRMEKMLIALAFLGGYVIHDILEELSPQPCVQSKMDEDEWKETAAANDTVDNSWVMNLRMDYYEQLLIENCNERENLKIRLKLIDEKDRVSCAIPSNYLLDKFQNN